VTSLQRQGFEEAGSVLGSQLSNSSSLPSASSQDTWRLRMQLALTFWHDSHGSATHTAIATSRLCAKFERLCKEIFLVGITGEPTASNCGAIVD